MYLGEKDAHNFNTWLQCVSKHLSTVLLIGCQSASSAPWMRYTWIEVRLRLESYSDSPKSHDRIHIRETVSNSHLKLHYLSLLVTCGEKNSTSFYTNSKSKAVWCTKLLSHLANKEQQWVFVSGHLINVQYLYSPFSSILLWEKRFHLSWATFISN